MEKYRAHSDQHLIELLRSGDNPAFLEIYDLYKGLLLAYAYQKLRNK